jgi:hypothetical protein
MMAQSALPALEIPFLSDKATKKNLVFTGKKIRISLGCLVHYIAQNVKMMWNSKTDVHVLKACR